MFPQPGVSMFFYLGVAFTVLIGIFGLFCLASIIVSLRKPKAERRTLQLLHERELHRTFFNEGHVISLAAEGQRKPTTKEITAK